MCTVVVGVLLHLVRAPIRPSSTPRTGVWVTTVRRPDGQTPRWGLCALSVRIVCGRVLTGGLLSDVVHARDVRPERYPVGIVHHMVIPSSVGSVPQERQILSTIMPAMGSASRSSGVSDGPSIEQVTDSVRVVTWHCRVMVIGPSPLRAAWVTTSLATSAMAAVARVSC